MMFDFKGIDQMLSGPDPIVYRLKLKQRGVAQVLIGIIINNNNDNNNNNQSQLSENER